MRLTFFDLIAAVQDVSENESETIATVVHTIESGHVRLRRFDLRLLSPPAPGCNEEHLH